MDEAKTTINVTTSLIDTSIGPFFKTVLTDGHGNVLAEGLARNGGTSYIVALQNLLDDAREEKAESDAMQEALLEAGC